MSVVNMVFRAAPERSKSPHVKPGSLPPPVVITTRPTGGIQDEIVRLQKQLSQFRQKNTELKSRVAHFIHDSTELLIQDFKRDLDRAQRQLEGRQKKIGELEQIVTLFRHQTLPIVPQSPAYERRMPSPRKFVMSMPSINEQKMYIKTEHEELAEKALENERFIILSRMKLRLCHDHRDLASLRKQLEALNESEADESEQTTDELRGRCRVVKSAMDYEKERIRKERWTCADEFFAAVSIQSSWRGFAYRRELEMAKAPPETT
jgi:hypothetical protein